MELQVLLLKFHGIPRIHRCCSNAVQKIRWNTGESSMELFDQNKFQWALKSESWWKRLAKGYRVLINLRKLIHLAKLNMIFLKIWKFKFHGILSKFKTNFGTWSAPISLTRVIPWNSMEFHGTWNAPISLIRAIRWNSMELGLRQFGWQQQFHGIPWNLEGAKFTDTSSSMEHQQFHGIWSTPISITRAVQWNSMQSHGSWSAPI